MKAQSKALKSLMNLRILDEVETARRLDVTLAEKSLLTPSYVLSTKGGALNGIIKHNLKDINYEMVSLNFHDLHDYKDTMTKYRQHLSQQGNINPLKRYFNFDDKLIMLSPFSYSNDKEKVQGFNDEVHFLLNGKHKVDVNEYFDLALQNKPDLIISPCEQVTLTSGKKKRKRSIKASVKNLEKLQRLMKEQPENEQKPIFASVVLGDDDGLDTYEIRHYLKTLVTDNDEDQIRFQGKYYSQLVGIMVYGSDVMERPAAYQEMKDFLEQIPKDKLRMHHGTGSPGIAKELQPLLVEVLNGIMAGMDIFESDYPLELAEKGIAMLIEDVDLTHSKQEKSTFLQLAKSLQTKKQRTLVMNAEENKHDAEPLVKGCECYACRNYNRAYFYHLLEVKEMNANILLGIHNVWQYNRFFEQLRANLSNIQQYIEEYVRINCVDAI